MTNKFIARLAAGLAACVLLASPGSIADETETSAGKGGVEFKSGHNSLKIGGRVQFRYTGIDKEEGDADAGDPNNPPVPSGFGEEDGFSNEFEVKRMRLKLSGGMFQPWLKYSFQFEFANTGGDDDNKIKDAIIEIDRNDLVRLKMGQFKTPFGMQQLTSSGSLQFVDRAVTDKRFAPGRDSGLMLHGLTENGRFGYQVGLFNGGGESREQDDQGLMYVGRIWWDPLGGYKLSESATKDPDDHELHFGLAMRTGEAQKGTPDSDIFEDPDDETAVGLEAAWRWRRLSAQGEYFTMTNEQANPVSGDDIDSTGFNAQVGFFVVPGKAEVALRYAEVDPDDTVDNDKVTETRAVFGYFWNEHKLKLQADVGTVDYEMSYGTLLGVQARNLPSLGTRLVMGEELSDTEVRVQMQLAF